MRIVRLGGVHLTTSRFLDMLSMPEIEEIHFIVEPSETVRFGDLFRTAEFFGIQKTLEKMKVHVLPYSRVASLARRAAQKTQSVSLARLAGLQMDQVLSKLRYDTIWIGDNDFDGSNFILPSLADRMRTDKPVIRSYKETRFIPKWDERYTLTHSDYLVFPLEAYDAFFASLYGAQLPTRLYYDLDWRYSRTIEWVDSLPSEKYSSIDGTPHVCLLCGRALSDASEKRSGYRYHYFPLVEELVKRGIHVHLHALEIRATERGENPYLELAGRTNLFSIEDPLSLQPGTTGYPILKRYDFGILHLPVPEKDKALFEFQKINIPNRLFEYQMAGVLGIAPREDNSALCEMLDKENLGVTYRDYDELEYKIRNTRVEHGKETAKTIKSFRDFSIGILSCLGGA
mgnify:CR=1 FL=1